MRFKLILIFFLFVSYLFCEDSYYIRYKLLSNVPEGVYANISGIIHKSPWYLNFGYIPRSGKEYPWFWIKENNYSPYFKIEKTQISNKIPTTLILQFYSNVEIDGIKVLIEISQDKENIITSKEIVSDGNIVSFLLPPNLSKGEILITIPEKIKMDFEDVRNLFLEDPPDLKNIIVATGLSGYNRVFKSLELLKKQYEILKILGINSTSFYHEIWKNYFQYTNLFSYFPLNKIWNEKEIKSIVEDIYKNYRENPFIKDKVYGIKLSDEPGLINLKEDDEEIVKAFREYLKSKEFNFSDFDLYNWDEVKPVFTKTKLKEIENYYTEKELRAAKKLYYHSQKFLNYSTLYIFKLVTENIYKFFPENIKTYINFTPHPLIYNGMLSSNSPDWIETGRIKATTMPWSEDWLGSTGWVAMSAQFTSFIVDILRAAAKYRKEPVGFYVVPSEGFTTLQKSFSVLGRGVKIIYFYNYGPMYSANDFFSENKEVLKSIGRFTRLIKKIDNEDFKNAELLTYPVAILWSTSSEIWKENNVSHTENMMLWLLLDRNHIIPDFITEEDIEEGYLNNYKVLFFNGKNLTEKSTKNILEWVKNGGILWLSPESGIFNEYNEENKSLIETINFLPQNLIKKGIENFSWHSLENPVILDKVSGENLPEIPVISYKYKINSNEKVISFFSNKTSALIEKNYGKGKIYLSGFMVGLSYGASSNKWKNKNYATNFNEEIFNYVNIPMSAAKIKKYVEVDIPGIEVSVLKSTKKTYIVLVNYCKDLKGGIFKEIKLKINENKNYKRVWTVTGENVKVEKREDNLLLFLPLDIAEIIVLE